jgi:hypothetical protein
MISFERFQKLADGMGGSFAFCPDIKSGTWTTHSWF